MSATMVSQVGHVQIQHPDLRLTLNLATMAKGSVSPTAIEGTPQLNKKPCAKVWEQKKQSFVLSGHSKVNAAIERHHAMVHKNLIGSWLLCQNGTERNAQTGGRRTGPGAQLIEPAPPPPETPPAPPGNSERSQSSKIAGVLPRYVYIHTVLPSTRLFNHDADAQDHKTNTECMTNLLTDEEPSTG